MSACTDLIGRIHNSRTLIIIIVFFSLLTDNMLLTLVDPILPDIIRNIDNLQNITENISETASDAINNNGKYGYLVAAKGATQFVCNPFVGLLVGSMIFMMCVGIRGGAAVADSMGLVEFGYRRPMLVGSIVLAASTAAFAFGDNYAFLFGTRMLQGAASSITAVTGMGLLACTFTDDVDRGKVMGIAIAGISVGIIAGPIYGSVLYQFFGQAVPFLALAGVVVFTIALQLFGFKCDTGRKNNSMVSLLKLTSDPYILIVAANVFLLNLDVSVVLAFLPLRLIDLTDPDTWQLGVVVLPTSIGYLIAGVLMPRISNYLSRWLCSIIGFIISTCALVGLAFCYTFEGMLIVTTFLGLALGMVSISMQPIFAQIVDIRHSGVYSNVYAISDMSVCLAMFVGPLIGGPIVYNYGFEVLVISIAVINLSFSQFSCALRSIPTSDPKVQTLESSEDEPLITPKSSLWTSGSLTYRGYDSTSIPTPLYAAYMSSIEDLRNSTRVNTHRTTL